MLGAPARPVRDRSGTNPARTGTNRRGRAAKVEKLAPLLGVAAESVDTRREPGESAAPPMHPSDKGACDLHAGGTRSPVLCRWVLCAGALVAFAGGGARAWDAPATYVPRGLIVSGSYPGTVQDPLVFVNDAVGAGIFYDSGLYGSRSVIGNVEAGHIWGGHDVFSRTALGLGNAVKRTVTGSGAVAAYDFHATMVGHVLAGTGYVAASGTVPAHLMPEGMGMAPLAALWSGAIATAYATDPADVGSFDSTPASTVSVYRQFFQGISGTRADVINSSFGFSDPAGLEPESLAIDALARANPTATFVAAAGNSGTGAVGAPGSVYNGITVGSLGGASLRTPSDFTSHGLVDFQNPQTNLTLADVRIGVDLAAPGERQFLAAYLGPTGGLAPLTTITRNPPPTNLYFQEMDGTSFASPVVAGGIALMKDAAKYFALPATALDSRVMKAVLMATAAETDGWDNGQATVGGVVRTTQALDEFTGAGALDLQAAGLTYVDGVTTDLAGTAGGTIGSSGWDLGAVAVGGTTDYVFDSTLSGPTELDVSLNWFTGGVFDAGGNTGTRTSFANLDLQVWSIRSGSFSKLVAESASIYNNAELLRCTLPAGSYGLRVSLPTMVYDIGATPVTAETYGLSWTTTAVPEPSTIAMAAGGVLSFVIAVRGRRR